MSFYEEKKNQVFMVLPRGRADASNSGKRQFGVYVAGTSSQITQVALSENDDILKLFMQCTDMI